MTHFYVLGSSTDEDSYFCEHLVKRIGKIDKSVTLEFELLLEVDYVRKLKDLTVKYGGDLYTHDLNHLVLRNGAYVGGAMAMINLAKNRYGIEDAEIANTIVFGRMKKDETNKLLTRLGHPCAFLEFNEDPSGARMPAQFGRIVIELFDDICPMACDNFMKLCVGNGISSSGAQLCYTSCPIHRLVPGGWLQCGDIVDGSGGNSISANGDGLPIGDESFAVDFGNPDGGVVGYASSAPHENGSQFFVTFGPCDWMQNSFVGFGRVVIGNSVLRKLENEKTRNQKPDRNIVVSDCGIEFKMS